MNRAIKQELTGSDNFPNTELRVGVACFPENGTSADDMISAARGALSRAEKEAGSNACCSVNLER